MVGYLFNPKVGSVSYLYFINRVSAFQDARCIISIPLMLLCLLPSFLFFLCLIPKYWIRKFSPKHLKLLKINLIITRIDVLYLEAKLPKKQACVTVAFKVWVKEMESLLMTVSHVIVS